MLNMEKWQHWRKADEEKLNTVKKMVHDGVLSVENAISYFGFTREQILGN